MKITITKKTEVDLDVSHIVELRNGETNLWNLGFVISIVDINCVGYAIVRVAGFADHAYRLDDLMEDRGTLYFYCGS